MTVARSKIVNAADGGFYHCISRCVRRAFLCGDRYEHRKDWIRDRLRYLVDQFAVEVAGYAVMANHFHVIVRTWPQRTAEWSNLEVAQRWFAVYPREYLSDGTPVPPRDDEIAAWAQNEIWVAKRRQRLGDLGWFMKALKEPIARCANKEDGCTGAFWEGRYKSVALLDQAALLACQAYVDLNPIRAKTADRPERSAHTAGQDRIHARQIHRKLAGLRERAPDRLRELFPHLGTRAPRHAEDGLWLLPQQRVVVDEASSELRLAGMVLQVDEYLRLLDATGRVLRQGKRCRIPPELRPILQRLEIEVEDWIACMTQGGAMRGSAVGSWASRTAEAGRRGVERVPSSCPLFPTPRAALRESA